MIPSIDLIHFSFFFQKLTAAKGTSSSCWTLLGAYQTTSSPASSNSRPRFSAFSPSVGATCGSDSCRWARNPTWSSAWTSTLTRGACRKPWGGCSSCRETPTPRTRSGRPGSFCERQVGTCRGSCCGWPMVPALETWARWCQSWRLRESLCWLCLPCTATTGCCGTQCRRLWSHISMWWT